MDTITKTIDIIETGKSYTLLFNDELKTAELIGRCNEYNETYLKREVENMGYIYIR